MNVRSWRRLRALNAAVGVAGLAWAGLWYAGAVRHTPPGLAPRRERFGGERSYRLYTPGRWVHDLAFAEGGRLLVTSGLHVTPEYVEAVRGAIRTSAPPRDAPGELIAWDVPSGTTRWRVDETVEGSRLAVSPDGETLVTVSDPLGRENRFTLRVRDAGTGKVLHEDSLPTPPFQRVRSVAFSPDGRRVAVVCAGRVALWEKRADWLGRDRWAFRGERRPYPEGGYSRAVVWAAFCPDNRTLAVTLSRSLSEANPPRYDVALWDGEDAFRPLLNGHDTPPLTVLSPDGAYLAVVSPGSSRFDLFDLRGADADIHDGAGIARLDASAQAAEPFTLGRVRPSLRFTADDARFCLTLEPWEDGETPVDYVWDPSAPDADVRRVPAAPPRLRGAHTASPDGRWVAARTGLGKRDGPLVRLWEARTGNELKDVDRFIGGE